MVIKETIYDLNGQSSIHSSFITVFHAISITKLLDTDNRGLISTQTENITRIDRPNGFIPAVFFVLKVHLVLLKGGAVSSCGLIIFPGDQARD